MRGLDRRLASLVVVLSGACGHAEVRESTPSSRGSLLEGERAEGDTTGAASEHAMGCGGADESPQHDYVFVAPRTGMYVFESRTRGYDGALAVFDASGAELGCNDDHGGNHVSRVVTSLDEGASVQVVQGGFARGSGRYELVVRGEGTVDAPVTLEAPTAPVLSADASVSGDTTGLPAIEGLDCPPPGAMQEWSFAPAHDGVYVFQVESQYDGYLALFEPGTREPIACNDDWADARRSRVTGQLSAGITYRVIVGGYSGREGAYVLHAATLAEGGALREGAPALFHSSVRDGEPNLCGAPAGSFDRTFDFTPRAEAFYSVYTDVPAWLTVSDGRRVIACHRMGPDTRAGVWLKARKRYSFVLELGAPDEQLHFVIVDAVSPEAPDWQTPPATPPLVERRAITDAGERP